MRVVKVHVPTDVNPVQASALRELRFRQKSGRRRAKAACPHHGLLRSLFSCRISGTSLCLAIPIRIRNDLESALQLAVLVSEPRL
jgi:hypothetical protein